jgi:hypothetical protein
MIERDESDPDRQGMGPWLHLAGLTALAVALEVGSSWLALRSEGTPAGAALSEGLRRAPAFVYAVLPAIAAISCGFLRARSGAPKTALRIALAATACMMVIDVTAPAAESAFGSRVGILEGDVAVQTARAPDLGRASATRTVRDALRGDLAGFAETQASYPVLHPRLVLTSATHKAALLMAPVLLVGLIIGIQAWVSDRVVFRQPGDRRIAQSLMAWIVAPGGEALLFTWSHDSKTQVLFGQAPLWTILVPYIPVAIVSGVAWRAALKHSRLEALAPTDPET